MEEKIKEGIQYANSTNSLERNELSEIEMNLIEENITNGQNEKQFIVTVLQLAKKIELEKEQKNG